MTTLTAPEDNAFVLIVHEVEDYGKWKDIFDNAATIRRQAGEIEYQLLACENDERRVVHFSRWTSLAAARAFFSRRNLSKSGAWPACVRPNFSTSTRSRRESFSSSPVNPHATSSDNPWQSPRLSCSWPL